MGGHGGLNILPQKSWHGRSMLAQLHLGSSWQWRTRHTAGLLHFIPLLCYHAVYNQDNREKVARDEANFEKEQAEKREQHRQAESQYRHAALLARARQQPLVGSDSG